MRRTVLLLPLLLLISCQAMSPGALMPDGLDAQKQSDRKSDVNEGDESDANSGGTPEAALPSLPADVSGVSAGVPTTTTPTTTAPVPYSQPLSKPAGPNNPVSSSPAPTGGITPVPASIPLSVPNSNPSSPTPSTPVNPTVACSGPTCVQNTGVMSPLSDGAEVTEPPVVDPKSVTEDGSDSIGDVSMYPALKEQIRLPQGVGGETPAAELIRPKVMVNPHLEQYLDLPARP